jgi:hypothetical protein
VGKFGYARVIAKTLLGSNHCCEFSAEKDEGIEVHIEKCGGFGLE